VKGHSVRRGNARQLCPPSPAPASIEKLRAIGGSKSFQHRNHVPPGQLYACAPRIGCFTPNARRCEIVHTRLTTSTAEREDAPHAVTPATGLIAAIRPGTRHNPSAQRRGVAALQPSTHRRRPSPPASTPGWIKSLLRTQPAPPAASGRNLPEQIAETGVTRRAERNLWPERAPQAVTAATPTGW